MRTKHGLKALGLCLLAALSLMAVTAAGAQAKGDWRINKVTTAATKKVAAVIDQDGAIKDIALLSSINGTKIKVLCETLALSDGLLFVGGGNLGALQFSTCKTFLGAGEVESKVCKPEDEPITATVKSLLVLHNGKTYILFSPDDGTLTFTKIRFGKLVGNECSFGPLIPVTGHVIVQCLWENKTTKVIEVGCENEEPTHLIEEVPSPTVLFPSKDKEGKFIHQLNFGVNTATLDGGALLSLPDDAGDWSGLGL